MEVYGGSFVTSMPVLGEIDGDWHLATYHLVNSRLSAICAIWCFLHFKHPHHIGRGLVTNNQKLFILFLFESKLSAQVIKIINLKFFLLILDNLYYIIFWLRMD
jgi:hypothetical protein